MDAGKGFVYEQALAGVAHGGALRLCIDEDRERLADICRLFKIDVAVARARFDDGNGRVFHRGTDEPRAAARDEDVDNAVHLHELCGAFARRILYELDELGVEPRIADGVLHDADDGAVGTDRILAAAQNDRVAALDRKPDGVRRDVGARLVNDAYHAEGHADAAQLQPVIKGALFEHFSDGTGKPDELFKPGGNAVDPLFVQHEPVGELCAARTGGDFFRILRDNFAGARAQRRRRGRQHRVHVRFRRERNGRDVFLCFQAGLRYRHKRLLCRIIRHIMPRRILRECAYSSSSSSGRSTLW